MCSKNVYPKLFSAVYTVDLIADIIFGTFGRTFSLNILMCLNSRIEKVHVLIVLWSLIAIETETGKCVLLLQICEYLLLNAS